MCIYFEQLYVIHQNVGKVVTGPEETLNSHLLVFAAEKARRENCVVEINPDGTF